jgi:ATP-dependent protease HslVU (ClpYQ) peptidase subunit
MTVIAWDGKTLAADKRTNFGGLHATTTKVHRLPDGRLVGCSGNTAQIAEIVHWLGSGADADKMPTAQRDAKECVSALVILPGGAILQYENTPHPIRIENRMWAIGSGRDFAIAAMHLGKTAHQAAVLACELDCNCGNGIDTLTLEGSQ